MLDVASTPNPIAYLAPGQLLASAEALTLRTVLGSCVAVCLYDPLLRVGGMNHFLLPGKGGSAEGAFRYGEAALSGLLREIEGLGGSLLGMRARIFGGARVLGGLSELMHLGQRNVEYALEWLSEKRVPIVERDVLGARARRLEFDIGEGVARVRLLGAV